MRLTFLGTGGYYPNERRHTACLLMPEAGIAFDAGTAFFRVQERLQRDYLDVFLTHAHLDHICGLTYFLIPVMTGSVPTVRIHGTAETLQSVRNHLFAPALFPVDPPFEWIDLPNDGHVNVSDGGRLSWIPLEHPGGSVGYRLDWPDRSFAYITDTTAPGSYVDFIRDVDVLVHECYFPDDMHEWAARTGHSAASAVAQLARDAGAKRLYLVHSDPQQPVNDPVGMTTIRSIFPNAELPEDLQDIEI